MNVLIHVSIFMYTFIPLQVCVYTHMCMHVFVNCFVGVTVTSTLKVKAKTFVLWSFICAVKTPVNPLPLPLHC